MYTIAHLPVRSLDIEVTNRFALPGNWMRPGIYQLWVGDQSYIGKARDVRKRLHTETGHKWANFDRCRVLSLFDDSISDRDLNNAEAYWIKLLRPELNVVPVIFH